MPSARLMPSPENVTIQPRFLVDTEVAAAGVRISVGIKSLGTELLNRKVSVVATLMRVDMEPAQKKQGRTHHAALTNPFPILSAMLPKIFWLTDKPFGRTPSRLRD